MVIASFFLFCELNILLDAGGSVAEQDCPERPHMNGCRITKYGKIECTVSLTLIFAFMVSKHIWD